MRIIFFLMIFWFYSFQLKAQINSLEDISRRDRVNAKEDAKLWIKHNMDSVFDGKWKYENLEYYPDEPTMEVIDSIKNNPGSETVLSEYATSVYTLRVRNKESEYGDIRIYLDFDYTKKLYSVMVFVNDERSRTYYLR